MHFKSKWITTQDFASLKPIDVFHKELEHVELVPGPIKNYHVHFRKKFAFAGGEQVLLRISADDYYKLYINEMFVAQGPAPAYADSYNYNEIDITSFLQAGDNILAVHVYYQGEINRVWNSADNRQGMIADIFVDGNYECGTDDTWVYRKAEEYSGKTIGYCTQYLENIDFNKKESGWKELDFPEEGYLSAVVSERDDHSFREQAAECLDIYCMYPQKVVQLEKGSWFLDFGTEITGQMYMKVRGKQGQTVRILCGEELLEDDPYCVRYQMRCNCVYDETCILSGQEDEFEFYDYKAFRYVNIITDCDKLNPDTFCAVVRHHKFEENCSLVSNVPWAEDIWKLCINSLKWGVQEGFLDCPSREKGQYLGDFTVSGLAYLYVTGDAKMYRKTLFDFAETVKVCKGLLSVAPGSFMQEIADFSLQYPMQVLHYYQYTKDLETVKELYPVVCGVLEYFEQYEREDGLLLHVDEKWNLIDWPLNLRDGYELPGGEHDRMRPCHNVVNAHYIGSVISLQKLQEILGIKESDKAERLKASFLKAFYDEEKKIFYDTPERKHSALHSNVLPVFYGIAPEESWDTIREVIMEKGLRCGTQFSYFVLKALGKMGAYEDELKLMTNESIHSWVNMIKEGATTCFEAWGKEQKSNTSLCHPWSCAPIIVLIEDILKVDPSTFGAEGEKTILRLER